MAFGGIPQEAEFIAHAAIITTNSAEVHEGTEAGLRPAGQPRAAVPTLHMLESSLCLEISRMSDANARQKAEDHYYAALDLMADGHLEKAVAAYQESLTADPTFTEAMHGLARALQDLQRYDEAIAVAQRLAEIDPDDVLAHTSLSVLYQKKRMIPEAEAEGAKARVLGWKQQLKKGGS